MTSKTGFNPAQTTGVQRFFHLEHWYRLCYQGALLENVRIGEKIIFQNEAGKYWIGTIEKDAYMFIGEEAFSTVLAALGYDSDQERMNKLHEDDWVVDMQGELPF